MVWFLIKQGVCLNGVVKYRDYFTFTTDGKNLIMEIEELQVRKHKCGFNCVNIKSW
jgi:hypothetical protein